MGFAFGNSGHTNEGLGGAQPSWGCPAAKPPSTSFVNKEPQLPSEDQFAEDGDDMPLTPSQETASDHTTTASSQFTVGYTDVLDDNKKPAASSVPIANLVQQVPKGNQESFDELCLNASPHTGAYSSSVYSEPASQIQPSCSWNATFDVVTNPAATGIYFKQAKGPYDSHGITMPDAQVSCLSDVDASMRFSPAVARPIPRDDTIQGDYIISPTDGERSGLWAFNAENGRASQLYSGGEQQLPFNGPKILPKTQSPRIPAPTGVPKSELHSLYGKAPRRKIISSDSYLTWHNAGQAHLLKWTSVFVCPLTGEIFFSGKFEGVGISASATPEALPLWFGKKVHAEHGAAAVAHDCLVYRDHAKNMKTAQGLISVPPVALYGMETPYLEDQAMYVVPQDMCVPADVLQKIQAQQADIQRVNGLR